MTLVYKYLHPDRVDVLENLMIRFTPLMRLNDLFEGDFILNPLPHEAAAAAADNYLAERIQVDQWREYLNRQLGVLSLSKNSDNLPMWVYNTEKLTR